MKRTRNTGILFPGQIKSGDKINIFNWNEVSVREVIIVDFTVDALPIPITLTCVNCFNGEVITLEKNFWEEFGESTNKSSYSECRRVTRFCQTCGKEYVFIFGSYGGQ